MKQKVVPGGTLDALTAEELEETLRGLYKREVVERIRAAESLQLDANGNGTLEVYECPVGFEAAIRRVSIDMDTAADPFTGQVALATGKTVEYLRSGTRIEWGQPANGAAVQVPGVQTWGDQQGPYVRNGEVFEVRFRGMTANAHVVVTAEGLQTRPPKVRD